MRRELQQRQERGLERRLERLGRDTLEERAGQLSRRGGRSARSDEYAPAVPSSGRWCTSSVARSRRSSRMRTSIGPENEATSEMGPVKANVEAWVSSASQGQR